MLLTLAAMVALACGMAFLAVLTVGLVHEAHAVAESGPVSAPEPPTQVFRRMAEALYTAGAKLGARVSSSNYAMTAQHRLDLAGNPAGWNVRRLVAARGIGLVAGAGLGLVAGAKHGTRLAVLFAVLFAAIFWVLPDLLMRKRGEGRQAQIQRDLPYAMDMLAICVQAGLGLDAAIGRVARTTAGPCADEFGRVLHETQFGKSRAQALRALSARTDVGELRHFVAALVQATDVGISISDVLDEQSRQMRIARRQRAEERAQKMQVKLLAPLITCLLPAMFIVVLGPAVMHLTQFFSAAN